jgi:hypothetical protein
MNDFFDGCESFHIFEPLVILITDKKCSFTTKITNAIHAKVQGIIIQSSQPLYGGIDYKYAARDISKFIPIVEISYNDGEYLRSINETIYVTLNSYDYNIWESTFTSGIFIGLFQIGLCVFMLMIITITIIRLCANTWNSINNGKKLVQYLFCTFGSYVHYITIIGCIFNIIYISIDPFHSTGIINKITYDVLEVFSFPFPFIGTFLLAYSMFHMFGIVSKMNTKEYMLFNIRNIIIFFITICLIIWFINILFSLLRGEEIPYVYYKNFFVIFYITLPIFVFGCFFYVTFRLHKFSLHGKNNSIEIATRRFIIMSILLFIFYMIWIVVVGCIFIREIFIHPISLVILYFIYFFLNGLFGLLNVLFLPIEKTETDNTRPRDESRSSVFNSVYKSPISIPHVTEKSSSDDFDLEAYISKEENNIVIESQDSYFNLYKTPPATEQSSSSSSYVPNLDEEPVMKSTMSINNPMSKASSMSNGGPMGDVKDL